MPNTSFLQSKEWADFQRHMGREVFEYNQGGMGANIIKHYLPFKKSYLYIPAGPLMDLNSMKGGIKNPVNNFLIFIKKTAKKENSIFVKVEPEFDNIAQILAEAGFKKSKKEIQPSRTAIIDLLKEEDELIGAMHHKTRYNIKVAEKYGIKVEEGDDYGIFWELAKKTSKRDRFSTHPKKYYRELLGFFKDGLAIKTTLFTAVYNSIPVASATILTHRETGYYLHGASDYEYRKYMGPYALHWHVMRYLKRNGFKKYDLWGVNHKKYPGVSRFKLNWGGKTIEKPGAFDYTIRKIWHLLYRVANGR